MFLYGCRRVGLKIKWITHTNIHSFQKQSKIGVKTHKIMKNGKILINICKEKVLI